MNFVLPNGEPNNDIALSNTVNVFKYIRSNFCKLFIFFFIVKYNLNWFSIMKIN